MKRLKPPMSYWGGKHFATPLIMNYVPPHIEQAVTPFIGGGSVEINLAANGINVVAGDVFRPMANFWRVLVDPELNGQMRTIIHETVCPTKAAWQRMKREHDRIKDPAQRAAWLYLINLHSFSGYTFNGNSYIERPSRALGTVDDLAKYAGLPLKAHHCDFAHLLKTPTDQALIYCDPPYSKQHDVRYCYGVDRQDEEFNHARLAGYLQRHKYWLLSYDNTPVIRELYQGCHYITPEYFWTSGNKREHKMKKANELLIMSDGLAAACPSIAPTKL